MVRSSLELCWDNDSPGLLDGIPGILPSAEPSFKHQRALNSCIFEHPSDSCSPHTELRLVYDRFFVTSEAEPSKLQFEIALKQSQILAVGSSNEVAEEVSVSSSRNVGSRKSVPRTSVQDNDILGCEVL